MAEAGGEAGAARVKLAAKLESATQSNAILACPAIIEIAPAIDLRKSRLARVEGAVKC
jgi:hypothetical protein